MHTKISPDNPYSPSRWAFAWEYVPENSAAHLDFGCHDGKFLNSLKKKNIQRLVGVDVSRQSIKNGRKLLPQLELITIDHAGNIPFDDSSFSSITLLDVLEHIYEQSELSSELNRVLKDKGTLVVTVPGKHIFSFLDMGNLKFRFPRMHRWYYSRKHSLKEYEDRYVSNPEGLIGDISAKKHWHEHFTREKLEKLLTESGFSVTDFDGTGFFSRVINNLDYLLKWARPVHKLLELLKNLDAKLFESTNLFCVAEKQSPKPDN